VAASAAKHFHPLLQFRNRKTEVNLLELAVPRCSTDFASRPARAIVRPTWAITPHPRVIEITTGGVIDHSEPAQIEKFRKSSVANAPPEFKSGKDLIFAGSHSFNDTWVLALKRRICHSLYCDSFMRSLAQTLVDLSSRKKRVERCGKLDQQSCKSRMLLRGRTP
jgi:hypothetical protein